MRGLTYCSRILSFSVTAAFLAGCGGSQPPITPGAMQQSRMIATPSDRRGSWMLPEAAEGDLIYALQTPTETGGYIIAYPSGQLVGYFGFPQPHLFSYGICSDSKGNVFAAAGGVSGDFIDEYAHDGTLIATLTSDSPIACSADPSTGNLAVVNNAYYSEANIGIYKHARGSPRLYFDSAFEAFASCSYDNRGNLFVVGWPVSGGYFTLAELPKGEDKFTNISLSKKLGNPDSIQWDGENLAIEAQALVKGQLGSYVVYRVQVSGSKAKILGTTQFKFWRRPGRSTILQGAFVAVYGASAKSIGYWQYPLGGHAYEVIKDIAPSRLGNLTISVAPK